MNIVEICEFMTYDDDDKIWELQENSSVLFHSSFNAIYTGIVKFTHDDVVFIPDSLSAREELKGFEDVSYDGSIPMDLETLTGENFQIEPYAPIAISKVNGNVYKITSIKPLSGVIETNKDKYTDSKWSKHEIVFDNPDNLELVLEA